MKKLLLGCALFVIATSTFAETSQAYNWPGPYVGIIAGPAQGNYDMKQSTVPGSYFIAASTAAINQAGNQSFHAKGFAAGVEAGYNWLKGNFLMGVETDWQALNLSQSKQSGAIPYPSRPDVTFNVGSYANSNWLFTLRPRIGFVVKNCLFFVTGGFGLTQINNNYHFTDKDEALVSGSTSTTKPGYALGGGIEYGLTQRFTVKAEYLYVKFNNTSATATGNSLLVLHPEQVFQYSANFNAGLILIGLNYKLD